MSNNYYTSTVRYESIDKISGKEVVATEQYLIDALSFTEAEERIHKEMEAYISGDFEVSGLKREKIADIVYDKERECDIWFKAVVCYVDVDEKTGREKSNKCNILVNADSFKEAYDLLEEHQKSIIVPWRTVSMTETPILDVFFYVPKDEDDIVTVKLRYTSKDEVDQE